MGVPEPPESGQESVLCADAGESGAEDLPELAPTGKTDLDNRLQAGANEVRQPVRGQIDRIGGSDESETGVRPDAVAQLAGEPGQLVDDMVLADARRTDQERRHRRHPCLVLPGAEDSAQHVLITHQLLRMANARIESWAEIDLFGTKTDAGQAHVARGHRLHPLL